LIVLALSTSFNFINALTKFLFQLHLFSILS
jgi:hypothetical protein